MLDRGSASTGGVGGESPRELVPSQSIARVSLAFPSSKPGMRRDLWSGELAGSEAAAYFLIDRGGGM